MVEKQLIINFSSYRSKCYAFIGVSDSEFTFLGERENVAFCSFLYGIFFIDGVAQLKK